MAVVFSPNIIEIAVRHTTDIGVAVNVWHMWFDPELGSDTKLAVVEDFRDNWQDHMLDFMSNEITFQGLEYRSLDPGDGEVGQVDPDPGKALTGGIGDAMYPPNVAYLIHKNTDARPRGRRDGRCYIAGVPVGQLTPNHGIGGSQLTAINSSLSSFYNGVSDTSGLPSGDRYPAVLETTPESRTAGTQSVTISSRRVTSLTVDPLVATQRERLR